MNLFDSLFGNINFDRFFFSLQYMWQGMLCIFIVTAVLMSTIYMLNHFTSRKKREKKKK